MACLPLLSSSAFTADKVFLGDLKPLKATVGWGAFKAIKDGDCGLRDGDATGRFLVDGKPAQKGIFTHADSEIVFAVPRGVTKFTAIGTMPNYQRNSRNVNGFEVLDGSWNYIVIIDGIQVFESEPLCAYLKKQIPIEVEIPENAKYLTLKTLMLGDGNCDHSIWAEPYFIKP